MGRHLYASIMRATVFGQFIAGDRDDVIMDTARWVASRDVTPMFAYTAAEMPASAEDGFVVVVVIIIIIIILHCVTPQN
jgi:hypothetical protein